DSLIIPEFPARVFTDRVFASPGGASYRILEDGAPSSLAEMFPACNRRDADHTAHRRDAPATSAFAHEPDRSGELSSVSPGGPRCTRQEKTRLPRTSGGAVGSQAAGCSPSSSLSSRSAATPSSTPLTRNAA